MAYCVYILASRRNGTLRVGVTNDLVHRVTNTDARSAPGFTRRYAVDQLVWFEARSWITAAIQRERSLKHWLRR